MASHGHKKKSFRVGRDLETKPSNPKDAIGASKLPMELVPDIIEAEAALAFLEGALKYGRFNWRVAGVRASIYRAALRRHLAKWWNGEDRDQVTHVKHLANIIACAGILLDAELCGKLTDDRPPSAPISAAIDSANATIAHLKQLFKDHNPQQYTIEDSTYDDTRGQNKGADKICAKEVRRVQPHARAKRNGRAGA